MKPEVEFVIKTGRGIVEQRQLDNPAELTERLNQLKQQYNTLGKRVTDGKSALEKGLKLSRKVKKELVAQKEWIQETENEILKREAADNGNAPQSINQELDWCSVSFIYLCLFFLNTWNRGYKRRETADSGTVSQSNNWVGNLSIDIFV